MAESSQAPNATCRLNADQKLGFKNLFQIWKVKTLKHGKSSVVCFALDSSLEECLSRFWHIDEPNCQHAMKTKLAMFDTGAKSVYMEGQF